MSIQAPAASVGARAVFLTSLTRPWRPICRRCKVFVSSATLTSAKYRQHQLHLQGQYSIPYYILNWVFFLIKKRNTIAGFENEAERVILWRRWGRFTLFRLFPLPLCLRSFQIPNLVSVDLSLSSYHYTLSSFEATPLLSFPARVASSSHNPRFQILYLNIYEIQSPNRFHEWIDIPFRE